MQFDCTILIDRSLQIVNLVIYTYSQNLLCQSRADALGNLQTSYTFVVLAYASIRKSYIDHNLLYNLQRAYNTRIVYFQFTNCKGINFCYLCSS